MCVFDLKSRKGSSIPFSDAVEGGRSINISKGWLEGTVAVQRERVG